jgi:NADH-quinone oxidoreductase subunit M
MLLVGFLHARTGTSEIPSLGGVARRAPLLTGSFLLLGAASIGVPGTNGFNGEHLILLGAFQTSPICAALGLAGVALGAAYLLLAFERAFLGPARRPTVSTLEDLRPRERLVAGAMGLLVLATGLYPAPLLDVTGASIEAVFQRVSAR